MKNNFCLFLIAILLCSCQSKTKQKENHSDSVPVKEEQELKNTSKTELDTPPSESETKELAPIFFDDKSQYSQEFIAQIRSYGDVERVDLRGDLLILNQSDSIQFPAIPKLKERYVLTGKEGDLAVALIIKRINYTTIEYKVELVEFGNSNKTEMGFADISGFFFLGSESDVDDLTEESYFATEFSAGSDPCFISIRIGNIEDSPDKPLLAKVIKNCNGEIRDIGLDDFPTLREK